MKPKTSSPPVGDPGLIPSQRAVLEELRHQLAATYPGVDVGSLIRTLRRRGLARFPAGFLVSGDLRDRGRSGATRTLRALARPNAPDEHGAPFSSVYYRLMHEDVAHAGVSAWAHYQVFGRFEGRSPHPLVDVAWLRASLESVPTPELVDEYLGNEQWWLVEPSPYVDIASFVTRGNWDQRRHPLEQLIGHPDPAWVHRRLMLIDSSSRDVAAARLSAAVYLLTRNEGPGRLGDLTIWAPHNEVESPVVTVIPGFMLARGTVELRRSGDHALSGDRTVIRLAQESIGFAAGPHHRAEALLFIEGFRSYGRLREIVRTAGAAIVAPHDRAQEIALRQLRRDHRADALVVLEHGTQARIETDNVHILEPVTLPVVPQWDWQTPVEARDVAVVLPVAARRRATAEPRLRALLAGGAALCLIDDAGINSWLPVIQSRTIVMTHPDVAMAVGAFVEDGVLSTLPDWRVHGR